MVEYFGFLRALYTIFYNSHANLQSHSLFKKKKSKVDVPFFS